MKTSILLIICTFAAYCNAGTTYYRYDQLNTKDHCDFKSYAPGGKLTAVGEVKAPKAVLNQKSLLVMLIEGGVKLANGGAADKKASKTAKKAWKTSRQMIETTGKLAGAIAKVATSASKVLANAGPAMVAFGAVMGLLEMGAPSVADLKEATDKAFEEMAADVNNRFKEMTGYVDQKFIDFEKRNTINRYMKHRKAWEGCNDRVTVRQKIDCYHGVIESLNSEDHYFMPSMDLHKMDYNTAKKLEVILPVLIDFGNLYATVYVDQIERYDQKTGPAVGLSEKERIAQIKVFRYYLKKKLTKVVEYVKNGVKYIEDFWNINSCKETAKCKMDKEVWEGWPGAHTANLYTCWCRFNKYITTGNGCSRTAYMRWDGKHVWSSLSHTNGNYDAHALKSRVLEKWINDKSEAAHDKRMTIVKKFWKENALDLIATLEDVVAAVGDDDDGSNDEYILEIGFSEDYLEYSAEVGRQVDELFERLDNESKKDQGNYAPVRHGYWKYVKDNVDADDIPLPV